MKPTQNRSPKPSGSSLSPGAQFCAGAARTERTMYEDGPRHGSSEEEDDVAYLAPPCPISPGLRAQTLKCVNTLSGHHSGIRVIAMASDRVYTGSYDNTIKARRPLLMVLSVEVWNPNPNPNPNPG